MEHGSRLERLRQGLEGRARDHLLVTHPANVAWLTGCHAHGAVVLVGPDRCRVLLDGRATRAWRDRLAGPFEVAVLGPEGLGDAVARLLGRARGTLAFEPDGLDWWQAVALSRSLPDGWALDAAGGDVECLRRRKDAGEIRLLSELAREACRLRDEAARRLRDGQAEDRVTAAILEGIAASGSLPAFPPIVARGLDTLDLHPAGRRPMRRPPGIALVDLGLARGGMNSDVACSVRLPGHGRANMPLLLEVAEAAFQAALEALVPGARAAAVASAAGQVLRRHGLEVRHDTGHGIGLQVHEAPWIAEDSPDTIEAGMVVCLEPGAYHPALGGARREEMVLVTERGGLVLGSVAADARPLV
ncbi:MAG: M24 family metallopeptidase [Candidatus Sericytochromatia bacterium]|nr:M24 family metallopeptidase [Candidatus Sericytochromatia bacterium]